MLKYMILKTINDKRMELFNCILHALSFCCRYTHKQNNDQRNVHIVIE